MKLITYTVVFVVLCVSCQKSNSTFSQNEINRISSPDSLVDAVVMEYNGGATTDFIYHVYIVPTNESPKDGHEIFRADGIRDLTIDWGAPKLLEISYNKARIFHFSNFWNSSLVDDFGYVVEIQLSPKDSLWSLTKRNRWVEE